MRWPGRRRRRMQRIFDDPEVVAVFRPIPGAGLVEMKDDLVRLYGDDLMFQFVEGFLTFRLPGHGESDS